MYDSSRVLGYRCYGWDFEVCADCCLMWTADLGDYLSYSESSVGYVSCYDAGAAVVVDGGECSGVPDFRGE